MRILFLAPTYLDLYKPIETEMIRQGHDVVYIEDKQLRTDCYYKGYNRIKKFCFKSFNSILNIYPKYWKCLIESDGRLSKSFDLLFCIQGLSFSPYLTNYLKSVNPSIKSALYIWDTCKHYDFNRNVPYFDKVYTFDFEDAKEYSSMNFLPFYWTCGNAINDVVYDLSIIGTDHDGRFRIINKMLPDIKNNNLSYYIKIKPSDNYYDRGVLSRLYVSMFHSSQKKNIIEQYSVCRNSELYLEKNMPVEEVELVISKSKCILDTDRESQTGTTPRVIWALSQGKGIISTNKHLINMPFYSPDCIRIIDRENPVLDVDFIKKYKLSVPNEYIQSLRIDKWVMRFIG